MKASIPNTDIKESHAKNHEAVKTTAQPFGLRDKIGYMFGDLGNCFILGLVNSFLMIYYTNVLGIAGGVVGILFLTARIIDAFADVTVGRMADVAPLTSAGRFRPWIRRMKYPFCIITIVLFLPFVNDFPMAFKIGYVFVTYLIYGVFLSTINIPYGSMASAISSDPDHRASLSTFRSLGSAIGGASTGFLIPIFMYSQAADGRQVVSSSRFFIIAIVCALLAFLSYNVTYKLTTERVQIKKNDKVSAKDLVKGMFTNKALLSLVVVDLFIVINQILSGTTTTYLFNDYFHNKQAMSIALLFTYGTVILLAPFATWLIKRFGKKEASVVTLIFSSALYLIMYFMHIHNAWMYLVFMFVATLGYSLFNLMVWAFITDVIDYHQYVSGFREDGTVYGVNSFARKVGQALAGGIGGFMLQLIGYQSSTAGGVVQSAAVENRIYALANLLPAVLLLLAALVLAFFYPLNKKTINAVDDKLKEINQQENN